MSKLAVYSPYSNDHLADVPLLDSAGVERALVAAERAFADCKRHLPAYERAAILYRLSAKLEAHAAELALLIAKEGGKPLKDAQVEVARAATTVHLAAEESTRLAGEEIPMRGSPAALGRLAFTTREPIGVVLAISAFNHPLNLIAHQVAPAIAAGCPVLIKPALKTPLSCLRFVALAHEAGLPEGGATVLICPTELTEKLAASPRLAFLSFIGSAPVGWKLRAQLAPGVRCALEHGGAAPVILDRSAVLAEAVPALLKGGFYHAGQVCVSVQRVFVTCACVEELLKMLHDGAHCLTVGDPSSPETDVGPLIRPSEVERVHRSVEEAVSRGARLVCGGRKLPHNGYAPTVLADVPAEALMMREEVFGPVMAVSTFDHLDEAIAQANAVPWAFQSAIFTQDIDQAFHAARRLNAAAVMINDHTAFRVDWMPFAGRGPSGLGTGGVPYAIRELTQEKLIVVKTAITRQG